jgi:hypothetical protein
MFKGLAACRLNPRESRTKRLRIGFMEEMKAGFKKSVRRFNINVLSLFRQE